MGKYMRKSKTTTEVALMDVSQSSLGVRTRAKTLALQRAAVVSSPPPSTASGGSYIQLRSRRLEKPPINSNCSKRQRKESCGVQNPSNSRPNSSLRGGRGNSGSVGSVTEKLVGKEEEILEENKKNVSADLGIEGSFGENVLEFEGRERGTRETTPCSLIRDPDTVTTPGSSTRPTRSNEVNRRVQDSTRGHIPMANEMDEFFTGVEEQQQKHFIEKYNYDPVNDKPLPGRFEWVKVDPKKS